MESRALASCRCQQGRLLSGGVVTWGGGADGVPGCRGGELVTWQHAVGPRRVAPFGALVRLFAFGFSRFGCLLDVLRGARGVAAWASGQHGEAPVRRKDARRWWARSGECVGGAHFPWRAPRPCGCSSPVLLACLLLVGAVPFPTTRAALSSTQPSGPSRLAADACAGRSLLPCRRRPRGLSAPSVLLLLVGPRLDNGLLLLVAGSAFGTTMAWGWWCGEPARRVPTLWLKRCYRGWPIIYSLRACSQ